MRKRREQISPDITPLIDIVFILLVFFIVSSVFKQDELALSLNLPSSQAKSINTDINQLIIELDSDNLAYLGKNSTFEQLDIKLSNIVKKEKQIIVRIDKDVNYERVVKLLDILQKYSLRNLALITQ